MAKRDRESPVKKPDPGETKRLPDPEFEDCRSRVHVLEARTEELSAANQVLEEEVALRRVTEDELREARERLADTLESMSEAFFILDRRYRFNYLNRAAEELYKRPAGELIGQTLWKVSPESIGTVIHEHFRKAMDERVPVVFEALSPMLSIWFEARLFPTAAGLSVYVRDITERKKNEESLRRQAEMLNVTYDAVVVRDLENRVFFWNRGAEERYGWTSDEVMGKVSHELFETRFPKPLAEIRKELFKKGRWEGELIHRKRDGSRIIVETRWALERDETGRPIAVMESSNDVTERKKAERDRIRLATAIESVAEGVAVMSGDGTVEYVNPAWCQMTGHEADDLVGQHIRTIGARNGEPFSTSIWQFIWQFLMAGESWSGRATARRKDGTLFEVDVTASPVRDSSGKLVNYIVVGRDITNQVALEKQLRQAQKMEAIGTLAGGIAHDFNNILAAIVGFAELAIDDQSKGSRAERFLRNILKAAMRGKDLARHILTYSRTREEEQKPLVMAPVVKENLKMLRASIPATIRIIENISDTTNAVFADATQVQQVVMNLCTNAAHVLKDTGGTIRVSLTRYAFDDPARTPHPELRPGNYLKLSVIDTGPGIPHDIIDNIFDPFFTTKKPGEGTGLGLSVTQGIVKSHKGVITVASQPGKGTVFDVYWPIVEVRDAGEHPEGFAHTIPRGRERILFVDDEQALVEVAEESLKGLGYEVVGTSDSVEALELFRHDPYTFDLVITDQVMPHLTGLEMAKRMMEVRPDTPLVVITGFSEVLDGEEARSLGIQEVIMKPIVKKEMAETIRRVLDKNKALR
ncbi:MAG: Blue-light-activated protein [Syntrophorhabdaceae bacterium PtaU1.Bin034]|nr:MAG: Blue-light-activated protein [Syntrophorhabdaceae bacterium PtaU1.Bin034]